MLLIRTTPESLFDANVLLRARGRVHHVRAYPGPLSIKSVVRGQARWTVGGQTFTLRPGRFLVTTHGEPYDLDIAAPEAVQTRVLFFADALVRDVASTRLSALVRLLDAPDARDTEAMPVNRRLWDRDSAIGRFMLGLDRLPAGGATDGSGHWDGWLREALDALADLATQVREERERIVAAKPAVRQEIHRRVLRGKAWLDEHFEQAFDLASAAREAAMAPHHFHRSFRALVGEPPAAHVARLRLERARGMLEEDGLSITDVCAAVGYDSLPTFSRRFSAAYGQSPSRYRQTFKTIGKPG
ncbi:helix-turn-helix domain-containing protein [Roseateles sp. NT4]|uniref:helix-turn-helix domain-containing protein n=1 Tax=Roseateles sp. NT4 TaxID=3453715 RepID=UPI003EEC7545